MSARINELLKATGKLTVTLTDENGNVKQHIEIDNLIVNVGKGFIASRMGSNAAALMSHMAIGAGAVAAAGGDTQLGNELGRVALTSSTVTGNSIAYVATFGPGVGTGNVVEAGLFNANAAGLMLARTVFGLVTKGANDNLAITWTVTIN